MVANSSLPKRFKPFVCGILFASVTWSISLYLYWWLTQTTGGFVSTRKPVAAELHQSRGISNDIVLPYENDENKLKRSKSKYFAPNKFKNSDSLINHLQPEPIKPAVDVDKGNNH